MKLTLEVTGGFAGPAGKQRVEVELEHLAAARAAAIRADLAQVPESAWGHSFSLPHPKPWDFRHVLTLTEGGGSKSVTFQRGAGPEALTRLAQALLES